MSLTMRALRALLSLQPKPLRTERSTEAAVASADGPAQVPKRLLRTCDVVPKIVDGMMMMTLTPKHGATGTQLLYLHGGAFVFELITPHWSIIGDLIRRSGATVSVPYYPLAPDFDAECAYPRLISLYEQLRSRHEEVFVCGDSAGGNLALSLAMQLRDRRIPAPEALLLFSPFVDAAATNPEMRSLERLDPLLAVAGLQWASAQWAGSTPVDDPLISPIHGDLSDLPPLYIYQGGCDILAPDVKLLQSRARAAGVPSELRFYPDGFHVFVGAPFAPESRRALSHAASIIDGQASARLRSRGRQS